MEGQGRARPAVLARIRARQLFDDPKQRIFVIHAREVESYRETARLLEGQAKFPEDPEWQVTQNMEVAATMVTGREGPAARYMKAFESERALGPADEELARVRGVCLENARAVQATLARLREPFVIQIE